MSPEYCYTSWHYYLTKNNNSVRTLKFARLRIHREAHLINLWYSWKIGEITLWDFDTNKWRPCCHSAWEKVPFCHLGWQQQVAQQSFILYSPDPTLTVQHTQNRLDNLSKFHSMSKKRSMCAFTVQYDLIWQRFSNGRAFKNSTIQS